MRSNITLRGRALVAVNVLVLPLLLGGCAMIPGRGEPPKPVGDVRHTYQSEMTGEPREFAMFVPTDYNQRRKYKWPLIVFLHGFGESGDDIDFVLRHGPHKHAISQPSFEFLVVAPQIRRPETLAKIRTGWIDWDADLQKIIEQVKAEYRVDESRIYLTGLSMGGFGTFAVSAEHPDMFAAVAPVCGGGRVSDVRKYEGIPFWIFHGKLDKTVPHTTSVQMYEAMKQLGMDVQFTLYPDKDHDSWTVTYENPEFYEWLLSHRLNDESES